MVIEHSGWAWAILLVLWVVDEVCICLELRKKHVVEGNVSTDLGEDKLSKGTVFSLFASTAAAICSFVVASWDTLHLNALVGVFDVVDRAPGNIKREAEYSPLQFKR